MLILRIVHSEQRLSTADDSGAESLVHLDAVDHIFKRHSGRKYSVWPVRQPEKISISCFVGFIKQVGDTVVQPAFGLHVLPPSVWVLQVASLPGSSNSDTKS